ncbi:MAG: TonB family protein [Pararhodobacter sp.]|nr:TonB family protein [Pararhodobacter sp.]
MKPLIEIAPFLALAVAVHVAAFALVAQGGVSAGGDGGDGQITLEGGDPGLRGMIADWERPPEMAAPPAVTQPHTPSDTLPQPQAQTAPELPALSAMAHPSRIADETPDSTPPTPPVTVMPAPAPTAEMPETTDPLPPQMASLAAPALAGLFERTDPASEPVPAARAEATLPDTSAPPPLPRADAPLRSPHPPARPQPQPRREAQTTRATPPTAAAPAAPPAQRAAGTGSQGHEGQAGQARETSRAQVDTGGLVAQWGGAIRSAVQRQQRHPAGMRSGGVVHLRLDVHSDGRLLAVAMHQSSGHAALDQAAVEAVRRARLPAAPQGLSGSYQFNLPVRFRG